MEIFADYNLLHPSTGQRMAEGHKASFCLEDNECALGYGKRYRCENNGDQGISVGCTDVYSWDVDCQWIDITDLPSGTYIFRVSISMTKLTIAGENLLMELFMLFAGENKSRLQSCGVELQQQRRVLQHSLRQKHCDSAQAARLPAASILINPTSEKGAVSQ